MAVRRGTMQAYRLVLQQAARASTPPGVLCPLQLQGALRVTPLLRSTGAASADWDSSSGFLCSPTFRGIQTGSKPPAPPGDVAAPPATASPDAEKCDTVIHDFDQLRSAAERTKYPPSYVSWPDRFKAAAVGIWGFLVATAKFMVSMPARIERLRAISREEWREKFRSAWATVKAEAKHYWAGTKLLAYEVRYRNISHSVVICRGCYTRTGQHNHEIHGSNQRYLDASKGPLAAFT